MIGAVQDVRSVLCCMSSSVLSEHELLKADEVADILRLERTTVWRYEAEGRLETVRVGRRALRYTASSVRRILEGDGAAVAESMPALSGGKEVGS